MKIYHILIEHFLGLRHLDIDCGPRMLVCGPNASGKSSVIDAIRFALLGEPGRVRLKKDYRSLLPPGALADPSFVTFLGVFDGTALSGDVRLARPATYIERDGANLRISVADTGIGINPEALPRIFKESKPTTAPPANTAALGWGYPSAATWLTCWGVI